jgi:hypothetical protein
MCSIKLSSSLINFKYSIRSVPVYPSIFKVLILEDIVSSLLDESEKATIELLISSLKSLK